MFKPLMIGVVVAAAWSGTATIAQEPSAPAAAQATVSRNDYSDGAAWLCRPGRHDACDVDLTTTVIAADGTLTREAWQGDPNAPVDCFYVYPTVSAEQTPTSDMKEEGAERAVARQQFARFGSKCRLYAPLYRQVTTAGLRRAMAGGGSPALDRGVGYDDVRDAWNYYLQHDNNGRGVVLIGHSQGSFVLMSLLRQEIDGKAVQSRLVSAVLLGTTLAVPRGKDVGGTLQHIPLCHSATDIGCVITYASFRATSPPPADSLFGRVADPVMMAACTNPAALGGGSGTLHSYFATARGPNAPPWLVPAKPIDTPWVSVPGLVTARCATNTYATYLEITVHGDPADPRTDDITGDLQPNWGLHVMDVSLGMGNLLDIVGQQGTTYVLHAAR